MSARNSKNRKSTPAEAARLGHGTSSDPSKSHPTGPPRPPMTRPRLWLFRFLVAVVVPVATILVAEGILSWCCIGRPMGFAYPAVIEGRSVILSNPYFTWQFFEPQMARSIQPFALATPKPQGTCRIFVLGSSAAQGDPEPMFGLSRILEAMLADQYPGVNFEVVNAATVAINSHVTLRIARACAKLEPDLFVVYMGNNEVTGPFGAGTVFSPLRSSRTLIAAHLWARRSRIGQALDAVKKAIVDRGRGPAPWLGMEMFLDRQVQWNDPELQTTYRNFRANLRDIFNLAAGKQIPVVVGSVAVNLQDCGPFASRHKPTLSEEDGKRFDELLAQGNELQQKSRHADAIAVYETALTISDSYADLHFRLAQSLHSMKDFEKASVHFRLARDLDTLRFRADSRINDIIRSTAEEFAANPIHFIDGVAAVESQCDDRLPGLDLFCDHVHFNFTGNYILARSFLDSIHQTLPSWVRATSVGRPILSQQDCEKRLCYTGLDRLTIAQQMNNRLLRPPFTSQSDHQLQTGFFQQAIQEYNHYRSGPDLQDCLAQYESAVRNINAGDWLHMLYARWLWVYANDTRRSRQHLEHLLQRYPQWTDGYNQMSKLAFLEGDPAQAESLCWKAIEQNPYTADAYLGLGVIRQQQNRLDEAVDFMRKSIVYNPYFADNHLALGIALMAQSSFSDANNQFQRAVELDPTEAKAWFYRGYCLMAQKADSATRQKAIAFLQKAVELSPTFAEARSRLALLFLQEGRPSDAKPHLEHVVKARPQDPEALYLLAKCVIQEAPQNLDQLTQAQACLEQAVTLRPDFEQAQYDLAVVLVNLGQTEKAKDRFRKVLQINPQNQQAKDILQELH